MKITKLFAVVAMVGAMGTPAVAETQHDKAPKGDTAKPAAPKQGDKPATKPTAPKPSPAPGMAPQQPRVTPNGRPACGNVMGKGPRPKDCASQGPSRFAPPDSGEE